MDDFKKYIQQHTERLDIDEPGPMIWPLVKAAIQDAETEMPVHKGFTVTLFMKRAIAACVIALAGLLVWFTLSNQKKTIQNTAAVIPSAKKTEPVNTPLQQTEPVAAAKKEPVLMAQNNRRQKSNHAAEPAVTLNSMEMGELFELENSFSQVINLQKSRISTIPMYAENADYFKDFKLQIRQIEKDEKEIRKDITQHGMRDELLDQLINLCQQKLSVLKQLQLEMNKTNSRYQRNHPVVDSTKSYYIKL